MNKIKNVVIAFLLILLVVVFEVQHKQYMELLSVCDDFENTIDVQRENNTELLNQWEESYHSLEKKYADKIVEYDKLESELKSVELPVYHFTSAEIEMIALCVECEAGDYSSAPLAQRYCCQVILNRVVSTEFPNSVEEVIYQKDNGVPQFSVAYNGAMDEKQVGYDTLANVYDVIVSGCDLPDYVLYFYSEQLDYPNWVLTLHTYDTVEGTVFAY